MPSVDERIVSMKMDNKQLADGARSTMSILDKLKATLNFSGSSKSIGEVQKAVNGFSLSGMTGAVGQVGLKFSAMSVAAVAAIGTIAAKAVTAGAQIAKTLTIDPIKMGLSEYEATLDATQTIMSGTGESVKQVTRTLAELNEYSDRTIYSFSDMTSNMKHFTNAGLSSKAAANVMIGISNAAASAGVNAEAAGRAMYGFGQSMAVGFVGLQDWNQIDQAGIATKEFKEELIQAGLAAGTLKKANDGTIKTNKGTEVSFKNLRSTLQDQWLSSDVLVKTLEKYSDTSTEVGKKAAANAQRVKTLTQLMGILQESAQSGWSTTFLHLFGDLKEASALWTDVNKVVGGFIGESAKARNDMIKTWKDLGGRRALLNSFRNIFAGIVAILDPIRDAFRLMFPATTGKQLYEMTLTFLKFTEQLKIGAKTATNIRHTFAGVFAIFSIGWMLVKALAGVLGDLFGVVASGGGSFLEVTANIGDWLVALERSIKKGKVFEKFFDKLGIIMKNVIGYAKEIATAVGDMFTGFKIGGISEALGRITDRLAPLAGAGGLVAKGWDAMIRILGKVGQFLGPIGEAIGTALGGIGDAIAKAFESGNFNSVYDAVNTGLLAGIILLIKKFVGDGLKIDFGDGLGAGIKETFGALTDTLSAMQAQIQAKTLLTIAAAIGILTLSVVALSLIDSAALAKALAAMGVAFAQLMAGMAVLAKISGAAGFTKIPLIAASLILLSVAVLILTAAVRNLSGLSWEELAKGLSGVAALLVMLVAVSMGLQKSSGSMLRAGLAMIPLAIGLKILASALKDFAEMSWGEMVKGLVTVAGALVGIALGMSLMPPSMLATSAGLVLVAVALKILASALQDMGGMSWGEIAKSLVVLAGSLLILAGGLYLMTAALPGAAALIVVALALAVLAPVLILMASMSWAEIGKGMVVLAGSLLILAGGLYLMTAAAGGAAALVVVAAALAVLVPILIVLGSMSWQSIVTGLAALAGVFLVIGVAGLVLAPIIPLILALGAALLVLGIGVALVGVGLLAIATAFSVFVAAATAGIAVVIGLINLIPAFMIKFAEGIGAFATTIVGQADKFTKAFASLIGSLLDAVIMLLPKIGRAFNALITTILSILITNVPRMAAAGVKLILGLVDSLIKNMPKLVAAGTKLITSFLTELGKNVGKIAKVGTDLIIKLMEAIAKNQKRLLDAGAKMIIAFINNLATTIRANQDAMSAAGAKLASAIISGMTGGLSDNAWKIANAAAKAAKSAFNAAKEALGINSPSKKFHWIGMGTDEGFANGIDDYSYLVSDAAEGVGKDAIDKVKRTMDGLSDISSSVDMSPSIRPVLDLSQVMADAGLISKVIKSQSATAQVSFSQASDISNIEDSRRDNFTPGPDDGSTPASNVFNQYNTSPKALTTSEIYRDTKNLFSLAKGDVK